jgi:methyltransferase-like protein/predicted O-methyltransferase YrrM
MSSASPANPSAPKSNSYDEVPYPSASFPQSHPRRVAGMARLFGLMAPAPAKARVLELGCADGANLLPMAEQMSEARFLGIDFSALQVEAGRKAIEAAGLTNVELRHQNILDFPASEGKFDYIIVHGIYSWVPQPVREKILAICAEHLTEKGVAYISYNALPGWNMRRTIRDIMLFHTSAVKDPVARVGHARQLLKFLSDSVPTENNAYGILLKAELELISKVADNYLLHDYLEEENNAFYFHEFVGQASKHGLQYLGETSLSLMLATNFPEAVSKPLASLGHIVAQEQYMDFLRNRMFRQTLLCRVSNPLVRNVTSERVAELAFQPLLTPLPQPADLTAGVAVAFPTSAGQQINASDPFLKAVLQVLSQSGAQVLSFPAILEAARAKARPLLGNVASNQGEVEQATLVANLLNLYAKGLLEVWAEPVATHAEVPERPLVSALVRHQAKASRYLTNRLHAPIPADPIARSIVALCDGTRTESDLLEGIVSDVIAGRLNVQENGKAVTAAPRLRELLAPQVQQVLRTLARAGYYAP